MMPWSCISLWISGLQCGLSWSPPFQRFQLRFKVPHNASFNSSKKLQLCVFSDSDSDDPDDPPPPKPSKSSEMHLLEDYFWEKDSNHLTHPLGKTNQSSSVLPSGGSTSSSASSLNKVRLLNHFLPYFSLKHRTCDIIETCLSSGIPETYSMYCLN